MILLILYASTLYFKLLFFIYTFSAYLSFVSEFALSRLDINQFMNENVFRSFRLESRWKLPWGLVIIKNRLLTKFQSQNLWTSTYIASIESKIIIITVILCNVNFSSYLSTKVPYENAVYSFQHLEKKQQILWIYLGQKDLIFFSNPDSQTSNIFVP